MTDHHPTTGPEGVRRYATMMLDSISADRAEMARDILEILGAPTPEQVTETCACGGSITASSREERVSWQLGHRCPLPPPGPCAETSPLDGCPPCELLAGHAGAHKATHWLDGETVWRSPSGVEIRRLCSAEPQWIEAAPTCSLKTEDND